MRDIARTCSCGMRIEPGQSCPRCDSSTYAVGRCLGCGATITSGMYCERCAKRRNEAARPAYRDAYRTAEYRKNRMERYFLVGGLCESCGIPLKGKLHPQGVPWEADHVGGEIAAGGTSGVHELRCRCKPCHHAKTAATRRARRRP